MTRLADLRCDDGVSLAELVVTMLVGGILLAGVATVFLSSLATSSTATDRMTATADARIGMEAMTRSLRVAIAPSDAVPAFVIAGPDRVAFYASLATPGAAATAAPAPTLVEYSIDTAARCLRESRTPAFGPQDAYTWPDTGRTSRCVALGDVNVDGAPLFTYYGMTAAMPPEHELLSVDASAELPAATRVRVRSVEVNLSVQAAAADATTTARVRDRVTLVNLLLGSS